MPKPAALHGLSKVAPELAASATVALRKAHAADLRNLRRIVKEEEASREAFGYAQVLREVEAANDIEMEALIAVCSFRCATPAEREEKGRYLLGFKSELLEEQVEALLSSLLPAEA